MTNDLKILYITRLNKGSTGYGYLHGFENLGLAVKAVDTSQWLGNWDISLKERILRKIRRGRMAWNKIQEMNMAIINAADEWKPDLTFFVEDPFILPGTLKHTQQYGLNFVHFQDDKFNPACRTYTFFDDLPYWDCVFVTRKVNLSEYKALGVSLVKFIYKAYTPKLYHPVQPTNDEYAEYQGDVTFIGNFNFPERADYLAEIMSQLPEVKFKIWGHGWQSLKRAHYWSKPRRWQTWPRLIRACQYYPLWYADMCKAMNANKIVLGFLNHYNRDLHTSRTFEIPACGGFMLMERTSEHQALFEEGVEAEYFGSVDEAVKKIRYYLAHDEERQRIAQAGHIRCATSGYSYDDRAKTVIDVFKSLREAHKS